MHVFQVSNLQRTYQRSHQHLLRKRWNFILQFSFFKEPADMLYLRRLSPRRHTWMWPSFWLDRVSSWGRPSCKLIFFLSKERLASKQGLEDMNDILWHTWSPLVLVLVGPSLMDKMSLTPGTPFLQTGWLVLFQHCSNNRTWGRCGSSQSSQYDI